MFETNNEAKVIIPEALRDPGGHIWWYAKLRIHIPWFYVTCETKCDDDEISTYMLLITQVDHLVEVNKSKTIRVRHVDLVIPGHMNRIKRWEMSPLSEIWVGIEPETDHYQEAYIFVLESGKRYVRSGIRTDENDLLNITKIFPVD